MSTLVNAIAPTLGPTPRHSIARNQGRFELLDDAGVIARRIIALPEHEDDVGAMLLRQVLWQVHQHVGDGAATTALLYERIYQEGLRFIAAGADPMRLRARLLELLPTVSERLLADARPLANEDELKTLAFSVCYDEEMAAILGEVIGALGHYGQVDIRSGHGRRMEYNYVEGSYWRGGAQSKEMLRGFHRPIAEMHDAAILVTDMDIEEPRDLVPVMSLALRQGIKHLLLIVASISDTGLSVVLDKRLRDQNDDRLIVVTPLVDKNLSLDVRARLARGRLFHPDRWQMVCDVYGVAAVDSRLPMHPWMADALLSARPRQGQSPARVLDADTAWRHVLDHHLGMPDGSPDAGSIIRWSMEPGSAERFARLPTPLAEAVAHRLGQSAGGLGTLMASGIAAGHAAELLPIGLVCDVLFSDVNGAPDPKLLPAAARLEPLLGGESVEPKRGREWAEAARRVFRTLSHDRCNDWLARAEVMLSNLKAEAFAELSSVLPSGFRSRLERFAAAATSAINSSDALESAEQAFRRIREHLACDQQGERIRHLEMALRLVRSLHRGRATPSAPAGLMTHHAAEGAFEDWARRQLLGGDEHPEVGVLFGEIHRAVRARREDRNRVFAAGVSEWLTGAQGQGDRADRKFPHSRRRAARASSAGACVGA